MVSRSQTSSAAASAGPLTLLPQILTARSIIAAAIRPLKSDRTGGMFASAERDWRGVAAEPTRKWVVPTAHPFGYFAASSPYFTLGRPQVWLSDLLLPRLRQ